MVRLSVVGDTRLPYYDATFDNNEENQCEPGVTRIHLRINRYPPALTGATKTTSTIIGLTLIGV